MAVAYRSSSRRANALVTAPQSLTVPSGTTTDDITIVCISVWNEGGTHTLTGGNGTWSKFREYSYATTTGTQYLSFWWKRATGADSGSYTFGGWSGSQWIEACAISFSGISNTTTNPVEAEHHQDNTGTNNYPTVSVTTADSDPMLVFLGEQYTPGASTPPTNWTEVQDGSETLALSYRLPAASGTYSTSGGTGSVANNDDKSAHLIAISTTGAGGSPTYSFAHDTSTRLPATDTTGFSTAAETFSTTHAGSAGACGVVVSVHTASTSDLITSVTYGGVTMTRICTGTDTSEAGRVDVYALVAGVPTGSQTVAVTRTGTAQMWATCHTVTSSTGAVEVNTSATKSTTTGSNPTMNIVPTDRVLIYGGIHGGAAAPTSYAAATGMTISFSADYGALSGRSARRTSIENAGTVTFNFTYATSDDYALAAVALGEVPYRKDRQQTYSQAVPRTTRW